MGVLHSFSIENIFHDENGLSGFLIVMVTILLLNPIMPSNVPIKWSKKH